MKPAIVLLFVLSLIACTLILVDGEDNTISTDFGVDEIAPIGK